MTKSKELMLSDFLEGINTMIDACSQAIHQRQNIKFSAMRDYLHMIRDDATNLVKEGL